MKTLKFFLALSFLIPFFVSQAFAQTDLSAFLTSKDLLVNNSNSNISLYNSTGGAVTVYGLYIRQFALVTPGQSCDHATTIYSTSQNTTAGAFVMPVQINPGQRAAVGANYLYNMIYEADYYVGIIIPSSPPGCQLPGCTWGADTTAYDWCIYLGALAPISTSAGYTSNVPPSTDLASSGVTYNYNLISSYVYLGPISCNDQTMTCATSTQQSQSF